MSKSVKLKRPFFYEGNQYNGPVAKFPSSITQKALPADAVILKEPELVLEKVESTAEKEPELFEKDSVKSKL